MAGTILDKTAIPFDGTDAAELAVDQMAPLLTAVGGTVHIVMVLDHYVENQLADFASTERLTMEQAARTSCERLAAAVSEKGIAASWEIVEGDDVVDAVVAVTKASGCTAIVLPTHGFSTVTRWLMGNLRDKIVQSAGMPVIVVPPKN